MFWLAFFNIAKVIRNHAWVSVTTVFASGAYEEIDGVAMRYRLSSSWSCFTECEPLKSVFSKLTLYPQHLVDSTVKTFSDHFSLPSKATTENTVRIVIPFKDQESANIVKTQLKDLSVNLDPDSCPTSVYESQDCPGVQDRSTKASAHCLVSNREGLGTSLWIMGLVTIDPHSQKEHTEIHKIPKFGVNQASFDWDTAI